jgi:3-hydroxybutyryl-CoA dehydrogenase
MPTQKCLERDMSHAYRIVTAGASRSFPQSHPFIEQADSHADAVVYIGQDAGIAFQKATRADHAAFVAIELDNECLGEHAEDEDSGRPSNVVGFARFRLGEAEPSNLVELVKQFSTSAEAVAAAKAAFEQAGLVVAVCHDFPGRIVNRLVRPYYNAALRRLDEKLATAEDMDMTLRLGLGYPEGPIALLRRTGLEHHYHVTEQLYQALRQEPYAPARRAHIAHVRSQKNAKGEGA